MTRRKLQKVLKEIAFVDKVTEWSRGIFHYVLHQNDDRFAITKTTNGKKPKLLNHEETERAIKVYRVIKKRSYAQEVLKMLCELGEVHSGEKYDYYLNSHKGESGTYYSVDRVDKKSQSITPLSDTQILENEFFKKVLGIVW